MEKIYEDAYVKAEGDLLTVGNSLIERSWRIKDAFLYNVSMVDRKSGTEWITAESGIPSPFPGGFSSIRLLGQTITADVANDVCIEEKFLLIRVSNKYDKGSISFNIKVYPGAAGISTFLSIEGLSAGSDGEKTSDESAVGIEGLSSKAEKFVCDLQEYFVLPYMHHRLTQVTLCDNTDVYDNLVQESSFLLTNFPRAELRGNLFRYENRLTGNGLVFLKEAPLPHARPVKADCDLEIKQGGHFYFKGLGSGDSVKSYPLTTLVYSGGEGGFVGSLQKYQRCFRHYEPERDEVIWHSIWGDRNRDGRVCEEFYRKEFAKNKELGIDHLYFIDGWQKGASSNSVKPGGVWENQWASEDYWDCNKERFPNGLTGLVADAKAAGFKVGMWYNPDKTDDYANWRKDLELVLRRAKELGISNVKFDGVVFTSKKGEENLLGLMREVVERSNGEVAVEIDISAGVRTGYYSAMSYGFLFLENRYTDWRRYYPYTTLRNLWQLSKYVDPRRLRIEFLNGERNSHLYPDDPLAPAHYEADYLFATAMFANPMAWFESTGLSDEFAGSLRGIIGVYKRHRSAIHSCVIYPIGEEPDGFSWSGFQAHNEGDSSGFVVVFRDNSPCGRGEFRLNGVSGDCVFELLHGECEDYAYDSASNSFCVKIETVRNFAFFRYMKH